MSIAIMGELVFISSSTDFSINKNPPQGGFKHIRYPDSFRACLMQVCNGGWGAFNEAHKSMDQIRLHTAQVPEYMTAAVNILFQEDEELIEAFLPDQLNNIEGIADECLKLADTTEKRFGDLIALIQELMEACTNANHFYGEELEAVKRKLEESKLREQSAHEKKQRTDKALKALEKELDQAQESYKKAMDSLPGGWEMIGLDFVGGLAEGVTGLINGVTSLIAHPVKNMCSATEKIKATANALKGQEHQDVVDEMSACCKSGQILTFVQQIQDLMKVETEDSVIDWSSLYDQKNNRANTFFQAEQFERIYKELSEIPDCNSKCQAQNMCSLGMKICEQLERYAPSGNCDSNKSRKIIKEVLELKRLAHVFDSKSKDLTKSPALSPQPPMVYKEQSQNQNMTPGRRATENARFAIEQTRVQMNQTRETYEKCVNNMESTQKELDDILIILQNCNVKEIDFKTTILMLQKGKEAMGRVQMQWQSMIHFFQIVSSIVKINLNKMINSFVEPQNKIKAFAYNMTLCAKDILYKQAFQASNIASLVNMISGTYVDVSSKYLLEPIGSLSLLMGLDPSNPEFERERHKLQDSCKAAQGEILHLVRSNKKQFDKKSDERFERISRELLPILPPARPEELKQIKEDVQTGFKMSKEVISSEDYI
ncbi:hypothetical protein DNTS_017883 [Danionella cerebrum]|uniref:Uncharacterized protein n=1 Tax=Danionella cerebrum TaxID=2873325 RepID=A0A553N252_9TELE|nr:hypothetical protein DNTS_017883 [Danionella translucida]